jgi:hypothetical protein
MLYDLPLAQNERRRRLRVGLLNILQATAGKDNWRAKAKNLPAEDLDADLSKAFRRAVLEDAELYAALKEGCERFARYRDYSRIPWEDSELRYDLIGKLRSKLVSVCLSALEPDLVILDEFQPAKSMRSRVSCQNIERRFTPARRARHVIQGKRPNLNRLSSR